MKTNLKMNGGFTLVELIVVIAILAILAGVAVPAYSGYIKKAESAADTQLLGTLNTAFTSACLQNGIGINEIKIAEIKVNADGVIQPISGITLLDGTVYRPTAARAASKDLTPIKLSFDGFFAGNENSKFKNIRNLHFDPKLGMFVDKDTAEQVSLYYGNNLVTVDGDTLSILSNSVFATEIGAQKLLGQVNDVSNLASDLIMGDSTLTGVVFSEDYLASLAGKLGMSADELTAKLADMEKKDPQGLVQFMANSTVLNVAGTVNSSSYDENAAMKMFAEGDWGGLGTTLANDPETGLAHVAMLYGLYTAYDPDAAAGLAMNGDVSALISLKNDPEFKSYLQGLNDEDSQAYADYQGYKAALTIIDDSTKDPAVTDKILADGYGDEELLTLLQGIMGR